MTDFFHLLFTWDGFVYFIILALLEIVLGIDNIIFISIVTDRLPQENQRKARIYRSCLGVNCSTCLVGICCLVDADG
jgi:predicted tellurium resistance membrane protein TerC